MAWLSTISWQSVVMLNCYIAADITQAMIPITDPSYDAISGHTMALSTAVAIMALAANLALRHHLLTFEGLFYFCRYFVFVPIAVALFIMASKRSSGDTFVKLATSGTGWQHTSITVLVGQVSNLYVVLSSGGIVHTVAATDNDGSSHTHNILWNFLINAALTLLMAVVYCFSVQSVNDALASKSAFVQVFYTAFDDAAPALAFSSIILGLICLIAVSTLASAGRQIGALLSNMPMPKLDRLTATLNRTTVTLFFATFLTILFSILPLLITSAFDTILSLAIISQMSLYILAILSQYTIPAPFTEQQTATSCGKWILVDGLALLYAVWAIFWALWPSTYKPSAGEVNWAGVIFLLLLCVGFSVWRWKVREIGQVTHQAETVEERK